MRDTKSIIRLYVADSAENPPWAPDICLGLNPDASHYLATVMRRRLGDSLLVFNGKDGEWLASIEQIAKKSIQIRLQKQSRAQASEGDIWLVFAPIKKARLDFIAQKATELGASFLQPVLTERTIAERVKDERLRANVIEAAEQCERLTLPDVGPLTPLNTLLKNWPQDRRAIVCDEDLSGQPIHQALQGLAPKGSAGPWAIFIGPEGGFSDRERAMLRQLPGAITVQLGPRLLRADTAAMAALSLFQSALGDW